MTTNTNNEAKGPADSQLQALLNAALAAGNGDNAAKGESPKDGKGGDTDGKGGDAPLTVTVSAAETATPGKRQDGGRQAGGDPPTASGGKGGTAAKDKDGGGRRKEADDDKNPLKTFTQLIRERATESDTRPTATLTLRKIIGGDILNTEVVRRQIGVFLLATLFIILYITNRYVCQRDLVQIDKLTKELKDAKYRALSSNSELTEKSRESRVLEMLRTCKDSTLHIAGQPPYIVTVPADDAK